MKRFFNVTSFCNRERHFMVDPLRGLNKTILDLIANEYFSRYMLQGNQVKQGGTIR